MSEQDLTTSAVFNPVSSNKAVRGVRDPNTKMSVKEFNNNPEVKQLSGVVFRYLNDNSFKGAKLLGIDEKSKEYLLNPAESIRDEIGSLSTLAARRAAIDNAPENVKVAYAKLLDLWENQTEIKGFGEGLTAAKDYAIDIFTSPETFIGIGAVAGKTVGQTIGRGSAVGASWSGVDDYVRQSKDVEINRMDQISKNRVLGATALGTVFGGALSGVGHKVSKTLATNTDRKLLNKIESKKLEKETSEDSATPVVEKEINRDEVDDIRDEFIEAEREIARRTRLAGTEGVEKFDAEDVKNPKLNEFNNKEAGGGQKSYDDLQHIIQSTTIKLQGQSDEQISNSLLYNLNRYANRYGSNLIFNPVSVLQPFTKFSTVAKSLAPKFRHDARRSWFTTERRELETPDFAETFKDILGDYYVPFKLALEPVQKNMGGKLEEGVNNLIFKTLVGEATDASEGIKNVSSNIRTILNRLGDTLFENGLIQNKVENNYFPRSFNAKALQSKDRSIFENILVKSGEAKDLKEAENIVNNMLDKKNQLDQGGGGGASFFYNRSFKKLRESQFPELNKFIDTDINSTLINYFAQSAKALAKKQVFGVRNLEEFTSFYIDGINTQMQKAGKSLTLRDKKALQKVYNHATGENLDRYEGIPGFALDLYGTLNRMAYLPLATISSLTEVAINIAKAGPTISLKAFASALNDARGTIQDKTLDTIKKNSGLTEKEAWRELQEFSMNLDPIIMDTVERLSGSLIRNQTLQKVNNVFFRATFLDQWTKFVQLTSYKTGKLLIAKNLKEINQVKVRNPRDHLGRFVKLDNSDYHVADSRKVKRMKDELNELGIDINAGLRWVDGGESLDDPFYQNIKRGAARYTNEVILNPTGESGLKPFWTGDPKSSILFQFLGYPIAFTNVVLKNAAQGIVKNPTQNAPKVMAAGIIMTEMARWTNWARSRGESEKNDKLTIYIDSIRRFGGNGWIADSMSRAREAAKVYQDPVAGAATLLGPVGSDIYRTTRRGDIPGLLATKVPGYGAFKFLSPEFKEAYSEGTRDLSKSFKETSLDVLGIADKTEPLRFRESEGGLISTGATVDDVPNVIEEPEERINPYTGEPYDVTAGPSSQDRIDRNDTSDPLRRLGFSKGSMVARVDIVKEYLMPRERKQEGGKNDDDMVDYVIGSIQSIEPAIAKLVGFNEKDLQFAIDSDKQYSKESRYRGQGDSIRHVMLGVAAARSKNPELAFRAIQLRESFPGDRRDSRKDKKNNEIGFNLGKEVKSMEEAFKKANILYSENKLAEFGE